LTQIKYQAKQEVMNNIEQRPDRMAIDRESELVILTNLNEQFRGYLNNKMTLLLLIIEHPRIARRIVSKEKCKWFLRDLYHHFISQEQAVKVRRRFLWLELFLDREHNASSRRTLKAVKMVAFIYEVLGMRLHSRLEPAQVEMGLMEAGAKEEAGHV